MADWFRFYEDFFDNPRYQYAIHQLPEVCPVTVLILTEHCRHKSDTIRWTGDEIDLLGFSAKINVSPAKINEAIKLLEKIRYIEISEGLLTFLKWNDLQSEYCRKKASKKAKSCPDTIRTLSGQCPPRGEERRGEETYKTNKGFALKESGIQLLSLIESCKEILGEEEMTKYHKRWTDRAMSDPRRLEKVLSDMKDFRLQNGVIKKSAGARAEQLWGQLK